ncbi:MAG: type II toxin-antitoxin system HicB family antitoxin [Flavobacterium sp.]|nr:MAG: type II toxin-antitoxin system HicB family antitoxin [Flavobacterium sp.]
MNEKFEVIIYWSEDDNAFIAEVPELAGCMADGKTQVEALSNAQIVIKEWIETALLLGREVPRPRGKLMYA